jgi:hypothetical protein
MVTSTRPLVRALAALGLISAGASLGCKPDLDQTVSIVAEPRILAVQGVPAEAAPKGTVQYTALYVDGHGRLAASPSLQWDFCGARKPLAELGPVSPQCLQASGSWFSPIGNGVQVTGTVSDIACRQFGPDVPEPEPGQPPGRPVDPDTTGGYYQPLRLLAPTPTGDVIAVEEMRLTCGLTGATADQSSQFHACYHANANPAVDSLAANGATLVVDDQGATNPAHPGDRLSLTVSWADCPEDTTGSTCPSGCARSAACTGAEPYVRFDATSGTLSCQQEALSVAWFATGGTFDNDRTGPGTPATTSINVWHAPAQPGPVILWVVLRDDRGGVGWAEYVLDVR